MVEENRKTAVVIGASRGIGRACALGLAEAGADVVVASRTESDINSLVKEIEEKGTSALSVKTDVKNKADIQALIRQTVEKYGKIDVMVYCSGIARVERSLADSKDENYQDTMDVNVRGAKHGVRSELYTFPVI